MSRRKRSIMPNPIHYQRGRVRTIKIPSAGILSPCHHHAQSQAHNRLKSWMHHKNVCRSNSYQTGLQLSARDSSWSVEIGKDSNLVMRADRSWVHRNLIRASIVCSGLLSRHCMTTRDGRRVGWSSPFSSDGTRLSKHEGRPTHPRP